MTTASVITLGVIAVGVAVVLSTLALWRAARRLDAVARSMLLAIETLLPPTPSPSGGSAGRSAGAASAKTRSAAERSGSDAGPLLPVLWRSGQRGILANTPGRALRVTHFLFGDRVIKVMAAYTGAARTLEVVLLRWRRRSANDPPRP